MNNLELYFNTIKLSPAERISARHLILGLQSKEIGRLLKISEKTVKMHLGKVYKKSGCICDREFLSLVIKKSLVSGPEYLKLGI